MPHFHRTYLLSALEAHGMKGAPTVISGKSQFGEAEEP